MFKHKFIQHTIDDKLKNSTEHKLWQSTNCDNTQNVTNTNWDDTQIVMKHKLWGNTNYWWNTNLYKTQIVMKQKLWGNKNYDETHMVTKQKLW